MFYKNKCVKWKKLILDVQNGKIYIQADIIALRWLNGKQNEGVEVFLTRKRLRCLTKILDSPPAIST